MGKQRPIPQSLRKDVTVIEFRAGFLFFFLSAEINFIDHVFHNNGQDSQITLSMEEDSASYQHIER